MWFWSCFDDINEEIELDYICCCCDKNKKQYYAHRSEPDELQRVTCLQEYSQPHTICIPDYSSNMNNCISNTSCPPGNSHEICSVTCNQSNLKFPDSLFVCVVGDKSVTRIPDMYEYRTLEVLRVKDCSIRKCYNYFPSSLRVLEISYCGMEDFTPSFLGDLVEINLSFNKLKEIPKCLKSIIENNPSVKVNLKNNDLWFSMYSDLSPAMISPDTVDELHLASKMNLVATWKLLKAVKILEQKNYSEAAIQLSKKIQARVDSNKVDNSNIFHNKENVHLTSIQGSTEDAIRWVMAYCSLRIVSKEAMIKELGTDVKELCDSNIVHPTYGISYCNLLMKVYQIACDSPYKSSIIEVLRQEIADGKDTCLTGQMTRLVNALSGFVADIKVSISVQEEMANSIIALRRKYAIMYGNDSELYVQEAVPAIWQLLEDCCVPEHEHSAWLEYV